MVCGQRYDGCRVANAGDEDDGMGELLAPVGMVLWPVVMLTFEGKCI